jgi:hypothetical protein
MIGVIVVISLDFVQNVEEVLYVNMVKINMHVGCQDVEIKIRDIVNTIN